MRKKRYPHKISAVYLNVTTAILSTIIAFLILNSPYTWLLHYLIFTFVVTVIVFAFKIRLFQIQESGFSDSEEVTSGEHAMIWKMLLVFLMLVGCLFLPVLLAGVLDPYIWFIFIVSFTSGVSVSEIVFYLHTR
jgi:hypothetical protein